MRQTGEPSVEEILESIKKVIARDNRAEAAQQRARRESASTPVRPPEVLELTETVTQELEDESEEGGLIAGAATASMRESLAALAMFSEPSAPPQIVRSGETSLEGLVRDMLRPMLSDWLEKNLPAMVEKMVSAEIARIAGKKG